MGWLDIYTVGADTPAANMPSVILATAIILAPLCLIIGLIVPRARSVLTALFAVAMLVKGGLAHLARSAAAIGRADLAAGRFHQTEEAVQETRFERLAGSKFTMTTFRVQQVWFRLPEAVPEEFTPRKGTVVRLKYSLVDEQIGLRIFAQILAMQIRASDCVRGRLLRSAARHAAGYVPSTSSL